MVKNVKNKNQASQMFVGRNVDVTRSRLYAVEESDRMLQVLVTQW